jgi:hypothetical protein
LTSRLAEKGNGAQALDDTSFSMGGATRVHLWERPGDGRLTPGFAREKETPFMFPHRWARFFTLMLFLAVSAVGAAERKEFGATFVRIRGDKLYVTVGTGGPERDFLISGNVKFSLNGRTCRSGDLVAGDSLRIIIEGDPAKPVPPLLVQVSATRPK